MLPPCTSLHTKHAPAEGRTKPGFCVPSCILVWPRSCGQAIPRSSGIARGGGCLGWMEGYQEKTDFDNLQELEQKMDVGIRAKAAEEKAQKPKSRMRRLIVQTSH